MRKRQEFHERFKSIEKAASYIGSGLIGHSADAIIEVIYSSIARKRRWEGKPSEAAHAIEIFGHRFPTATVRYHSENGDGFIAEVHCHCPFNTRDSCCTRGDDRPRILIMEKHP